MRERERKTRKKYESYGVETEARIERVKMLVGKYMVYRKIEPKDGWKAWFALYDIYGEMSGVQVVIPGKKKKGSYLGAVAADGGLETLELAARKLAENCMGVESRREEVTRLAMEALQDIKKETFETADDFEKEKDLNRRGEVTRLAREALRDIKKETLETIVKQALDDFEKETDGVKAEEEEEALRELLRLSSLSKERRR